LLDQHTASGAAATLLTSEGADPTGYGRILREGENIVGIVEDRDAGVTQLQISEVNTSVYAFEAPLLEAALARVNSDNNQDEFYLTDVIEILAAQGHHVGAVLVDEIEASGVNAHDQLAEVAAVLRYRINREWMENGVWMLDPDRVYIDATALIEPGVRLYPGVHIEGDTAIGAGAEVGPEVHIRDSTIGTGARVRYAVLADAVVGPDVSVGPFAYLRPGAELRSGSKVGTFVEIKKSTVGEGAKVPHLSYIGDATIGEATNIGAGTITCNWDGFEKHPTTIGSRVFVGSDTMLVAPVELGDDSVTGAGSVITEDVAPGSLAVERSEQRDIKGYAERRRRRAQEDQE
jgi:bifunctional UDP-N-acetylglucosamine pyrophosphorylase/glucosamine-1-phosphate N-acetyltransferase